LVAYVVGQGSAAPESGELRGYLEERLPRYMVPAVYVEMERLPQTPNGKVDRRALPEPRRAGAAAGYVAPRDELEQELAAIWERALGVRPIGVDESFFHLGGHSLVAVQVFNEIERTIGDRLPLSTLFRAPTIGQLADVLRER
ncbi:MAG TPA: phosphopantetheine-binding protein, partial [Terriglobales bacterium]|nr:phosphopantetheine-binding protein [Terriglobales bacterium]